MKTKDCDLMIYLLFIVLPLLCGCSSNDDQLASSEKRANVKGEYIFRKHNEYFYNPSLPKVVEPPIYPWESRVNLPEITKEYFRCKGNCMHPELIEEHDGKLTSHFDCDGNDEHGLPLREGKEFIYTILIDILNYIQEETGKRVIITSGHRCPAHNIYIDTSKENLYSKHLIGAEVSFYVDSMEYHPRSIIDLLINYYQMDSSEYATFIRYEKSNTNVRTKPWYNKEVFVKLFETDEGRNLDNQHPYPYISIQVRYDREHDERVTYSWNKAHKGYLRK